MAEDKGGPLNTLVVEISDIRSKQPQDDRQNISVGYRAVVSARRGGLTEEARLDYRARKTAMVSGGGACGTRNGGTPCRNLKSQRKKTKPRLLYLTRA